jgi:hypothetical protein
MNRSILYTLQRGSGWVFPLFLWGRLPILDLA